MPIKPIRRKSVSDEVFIQMQKLILSGEWAPGSKIPSESELKEMFSVSRISIREAMQKLSILGIVETRPGSGTYVSELSAGLYMNSLLPVFLLDKPNIAQILEFRKAIEVESVELVAQRARQEEIDYLQKILTDMEQMISDSEKFAKLDFHFHQTIAEMTHNPLIIKVNLILREVMELGFIQQTKVIGGYQGFVQHKQIFEAIKNKNSELARKYMSEHINCTRKRLLELCMDTEAKIL